MNFKDKLNEYLKITNCSSKELSTLSNISETVISRYRNGQRVPKTNSKQLKSISGALEKIIKDRTGKKSMGFNAQIESKKEQHTYEVFKDLLPQDLLKFGLIPEFVGRLPIIATLQELDRDALVEIVTKPKNALVKQYKKLLELDGVELEFEQDALNAIVEKANLKSFALAQGVGMPDIKAPSFSAEISSNIFPVWIPWI